MPGCILLQFNWLIGDLSSGTIGAARVVFFIEEIISAISFSKETLVREENWCSRTEEKWLTASLQLRCFVCVDSKTQNSVNKKKPGRRAVVCLYTASEGIYSLEGQYVTGRQEGAGKTKEKSHPILCDPEIERLPIVWEASSFWRMH